MFTIRFRFRPLISMFAGAVHPEAGGAGARGTPAAVLPRQAQRRARRSRPARHQD